MALVIVEVCHISAELQLSNIFTTSLSRRTFTQLSSKLSVDILLITSLQSKTCETERGRVSLCTGQQHQIVMGQGYVETNCPDGMTPKGLLFLYKIYETTHCFE